MAARVRLAWRRVGWGCDEDASRERQRRASDSDLWNQLGARVITLVFLMQWASSITTTLKRRRASSSLYLLGGGFECGGGAGACCGLSDGMGGAVVVAALVIWV
jgi:hypothetical protein